MQTFWWQCMFRHRRTGGTGAHLILGAYLLNNFWRKVKFSKGKIRVSNLKHWFPNHLVLALLSTFWQHSVQSQSAVLGNAIRNDANQKSATRPDDLGQWILHRTTSFEIFFCTTTIFCRCKNHVNMCSIRSVSTPFAALLGMNFIPFLCPVLYL